MYRCNYISSDETISRICMYSGDAKPLINKHVG